MTPEEKPLWVELEKSIHEPARLGLITCLCSNPDGLGFPELKAQCGLTDGNLNRHLAVLGEAGLIETFKGANRSRPQTLYRLTRSGRERFAEYINVLEKVVTDAQNEISPASIDGKPKGWAAT